MKICYSKPLFPLGGGGGGGKHKNKKGGGGGGGGRLQYKSDGDDAEP